MFFFIFCCVLLLSLPNKPSPQLVGFDMTSHISQNSLYHSFVKIITKFVFCLFFKYIAFYKLHFLTTFFPAPSAIYNLTAIPTSSGEGFQLSWQPPSSRCQPITYRVEYQLINIDQCRVEEGSRRVTAGVTSSENTNYELTGLEPYSTYDLFVVALGQADDSPDFMISAMTDQHGEYFLGVTCGHSLYF